MKHVIKLGLVVILLGFIGSVQGEELPSEELYNPSVYADYITGIPVMGHDFTTNTYQMLQVDSEGTLLCAEAFSKELIQCLGKRSGIKLKAKTDKGDWVPLFKCKVEDCRIDSLTDIEFIPEN